MINKFVFISHYWTDVPTTGGEFRQSAIVNGLSDIGKTRVICPSWSRFFYHSKASTETLRLPCDRETESLVKYGLEIFGPDPFSMIAATLNSDLVFRKHLADSIDKDEILVYSHQFLAWSSRLFVRNKKHFALHNDETHLRFQILNSYSSTPSVTRARQISAIDKLTEIVLNNANQVSVCTPADWTATHNENLFVIPNGFNQKLFKRDHKISKVLNNPYVIFVGSAHEPNIRAVKHLVAVASFLHSIQFKVVGSVGSFFKNEMNNVEFVGVVSDAELTDLYMGATASLILLEEGSGTSIKTIECMALGVPVAGTSTAFRGIESSSKANLILDLDIDPISEIANKFLKWMNELSSSGEVLINLKSWSDVSHDFADLLQKI